MNDNVPVTKADTLLRELSVLYQRIQGTQHRACVGRTLSTTNRPSWAYSTHSTLSTISYWGHPTKTTRISHIGTRCKND